MIDDPYETKTFWPRIGRTLLGIAVLLGVIAVVVMFALPPDGRPDPGPRGWPALLLLVPFLAAMAVVLVRRLVRPRPVLVLAPSGLTPTFSPEVPWSRIAHVSEASIRGNRFLLVHLHDEAGYLEQVTGLRRRMLVANQRVCQAAIALNLRDVGLPVEQLAAEIEGRRLRFGGA